MAAFHRSAAATTLDDTITFIRQAAATSSGVTLDQIASHCGVSVTAARNRLHAALEVMVLYHAQRLADIGGRALDTRWFAHKADADAFTRSAAPARPGTAAPRMQTQVVTLTRIPASVRHGADDHRRFGSRRGDFIYYPNGDSAHISET